MSDEQENVEAGSETSGETAPAESSQEETTATDTAAESTDVEPAQDAGGAAEPKAGDACTCPDGRAGTLHSFDEGLICLPNHDQG